jgi:peroxiredoxin Q/BCP
VVSSAAHRLETHFAAQPVSRHSGRVILPEFSMLTVSRSTARRIATLTGTALTVAMMFGASVASAQGAPAILAVGTMAPDFTIKSVTENGLTAKPFKLSEHKGETVVLAFFPKARTSGCTTQMTSYRDQYADLMHGGKKVTLVAISVDPDSALTSWAKDAKFPFMFGSDENRAVGVKYGASAGTGYHKRIVYVIDPAGKITYAVPFQQLAAEAYTKLGEAIDQSAGSKH